MFNINGGKTSGSVSKNTSFVILGKETGSSKHQKAIELGIPILSEEEFMKLIERRISYVKISNDPYQKIDGR